MLSACKKPFPTHRCGQCEYCRVMDRMDKVNRLKLEYGMRPHAFFITLTYDDDSLPIFNYSRKAELYRPDLVKFIKDIRNYLPKITVFAIGEYGGYLFDTPDAVRPIHPHYHIAIFSDCPSINSRIRAVSEKAWRLGHCHLLHLSNGLIDYITGYVSKKITNQRSMEKLYNLNIRPEFPFSSRRPAIGDISDKLIPIVEQYGDLTHLIIDGKKVTIPKYLKFKIKNEFLKWDLDLDNPEHQQIYERRKFEKKIETMQTLHEKNQEEKAILDERKISRSDVKRQIIANFESKQKLLKSTKTKKVL